MRDIDLNKAMQIAVKCAKEAGRLQMKSFGKSLSIRSRSMYDIKLAVDVICEKAIKKILNKHYPSFSILAEETGLSKKQSEYRWIVDPLDGTCNYSRAIPYFSCSIALEKDSDILLGVVYDPLRDELWTAIKGMGAFRNGKKIQVSKISKLSESVIAIGFMKNKKTISDGIKMLNSIIFKVKKVRVTGSASLNICYVADARFDVYFENGIMLWDIAAGSVILEEAGGRMDKITQNPDYSVDVVAGNGKINLQLFKTLL